MIKQMIGIDIGGTAIKLALIDVYGEIHKKWQIPTNISDNGRKIPTDIISSIQHTILDQKHQESEIIGVGIGVPGPISPDGQTVVRAVNLGWEDMPLKSAIEKELDIPVVLLNDANAAALGEMWKGAARGKASLVFITLGTGVGGGIIIDGKVINGVHSSGGEIGHIPVYSEEKRVCGCGNINCLETFASANGFVKTMKMLLPDKTTKFTAVDIFDWAKADDSKAKEALAITVTYLGKAIAGIMNTVDAEEVVIGGGLSGAGTALLKPLKEQIDRSIFPAIRGNYKLSRAQLGNDAGIYGAVYSYLSSDDSLTFEETTGINA
ncbi:glucokinase [Enterococcus florum]|uniref:Glucokinase n=1 Tax=Enterococcus florum TaxID=2480627 RepID=A0A4V0WP59_9ENTE|nr:ROK family protein [Enterococcus florum]GCF92719.1 glucokinase [Enterococcus florum]